MERRSKPRVPLRVPAQVDLGDQKVACMVVDISEHGLAVLIDARVEPSNLMQVEFRLGKEDAAQATLDAELVEQRPSQAGLTTVWGLRTVGADLGTRTRVRGFVRQALAS